MVFSLNHTIFKYSMLCLCEWERINPAMILVISITNQRNNFPHPSFTGKNPLFCKCEWIRAWRGINSLVNNYLLIIVAIIIIKTIYACYNLIPLLPFSQGNKPVHLFYSNTVVGCRTAIIQKHFLIFLHLFLYHNAKSCASLSKEWHFSSRNILHLDILEDEQFYFLLPNILS